MWGRDIKICRREVMGLEMGREKDREIELKTFSTHGSRGIPLVLLHPQLPSCGYPKPVLLGIFHLFTFCYLEFEYLWGSSRCCSHNVVWYVYKSCFLSHSLPHWEFWSTYVIYNVITWFHLSRPGFVPSCHNFLSQVPAVAVYLMAHSFCGLDWFFETCNCVFKVLNV